MHIGNSNDHVNYTLNGSDLVKVNQEKYLGIIINNDNKPEKHISEAVKTANKLIGFIGRAFKYKSQKSYSRFGGLWCNGSALCSQPKGPGFDPKAEWKNLGVFSDTPTPLFT